MKKTLDESQMIELKKLGYMKDDSLAGLIEFLLEYDRNILPWNVLTWQRDEELVDFLTEEIRDILELRHKVLKKHER